MAVLHDVEACEGWCGVGLAVCFAMCGGPSGGACIPACFFMYVACVGACDS